MTSLGLLQTVLLLWIAEAAGFIAVMLVQGRRDDRLERIRGRLRHAISVDMLTKINRAAKSPGHDTTTAWRNR